MPKDKDKETVRVQADLPKEQYEQVRDKLPVMETGGDTNLVRYVIQDWLRRVELEEAEAGLQCSDTD